MGINPIKSYVKSWEKGYVMKSLRMKLFVSFSALIVIAIILGSMGTINLRSSKNRVDTMISENYELVDLATQMSENVALRVIDARGYVMYGDTTYRDEFMKMTDESEETLEKLEAVIGDTPEYKEAVEKTYRWRDLIIEDVIPAYERGGYEAAIPIMEEYCQVWSIEAIDEWNDIKTVASDDLKKNGNEIVADAGGLIVINLIASIIAILVGLALVYYLNKTIVIPVKKVNTSLERISKNDLTGEDIEVDSKDEIFTLSQSTNNLKNQLRNIVGNLVEKSHLLDSSSDELSQNSERTSGAYTEVARTIEEIALGATSQAQDTEDGAHVVGEMEVVLNKNHDYMDRLNESTERVDLLKNQGIESMADLVEKTKENQRASKEIQEVIESTNESAKQIEKASQMIESISDQTNLLALNASIEAASAGEHGKGFAVVAEEIRKLAEESSRFTEDIKNTVSQLGNRTNEAVKTMDRTETIVMEQSQTVMETQERFNGINEAIESIKSVIENLNLSSDELDEKKQGLLDMISNLSSIAQENAAGSQEVSASVEEQTVAIEEIARSSQGLAELAEDLNQVVDSFKI